MGATIPKGLNRIAKIGYDQGHLCINLKCVKRFIGNWYKTKISVYIYVCNHGFITELNGFNLSAGKIYAGLIIAENWKAYKASQSKGGNHRMVRFLLPGLKIIFPHCFWKLKNM